MTTLLYYNLNVEKLYKRNLRYWYQTLIQGSSPSSDKPGTRTVGYGTVIEFTEAGQGKTPQEFS